MNKDLFYKIKNSSIVEIIKNYLSLTRKGANYLAVCPFHNDTKPSLTINDQKGIWKCFACGESGDAIHFVAKFEHLSLSQAAIKIAKDLNLDLSLIKNFEQENAQDLSQERLFSLNKVYLQFCQNFLQNKSSTLAQNYLKTRHIDSELINHFGIGYNPDGKKQLYELLTNEQNNFINLDKDNLFSRNEVLDCGLIHINGKGDIYDTFRNRIVFSIKDENGNIVGFSGRSINNDEPKYLNSPETKLFKKSHLLYHWFEVKNYFLTQQLYIVEGFMDVMALYKVGIKNVVATMGTAFGNNHLQMLKNTKQISSIILGFDNDQAGYAATIKTGMSLAKHFNVYVVKQYDSSCKDFDELLNKTDSQTLVQIVNNQIHFSLFYLQTIIHEYNLTTPAGKQDYLNKALSCIKSFGNALYKQEYLDFLQQATNYDSKTLVENITSCFVKNRFTSNASSKYIKPINKTYSKKLAHDLKTFSNVWKRLIMSCLIDKSAISNLKKLYPFYGVTNFYPEFDTEYNYFTNMLNIIHDYYLAHPELTSISLAEYANFQLFLKDYKFKINLDKYMQLFSQLLEANHLEYMQYKYSINNLLESIKACATADLSLRQNIIIKRVNDSLDGENKQQMWREYTSLTNKINELQLLNREKNIW